MAMSALAAVPGEWTFDAGTAAAVVLLGGVYLRCRRGDADSRKAESAIFLAGLVVWVLAVMSAIGVYTPLLFWVKALQTLLLLFVVPFFLALGRPLSVIRAAVSPHWQGRIDAVLGSGAARAVVHPFTTSAGMLLTPWLLYLTPWYRATLEQPAVAGLTRILLVVIGFGYFYARLQADPVPHRYSQMVSMVISIVESLADGVLGLVLWQGPLIAADYYAAVRSGWGPSLRTDQSIGAGILWIMGDVLSVPFLMILMRALKVDDTTRAAEIDRELDRQEREEPDSQAGEDGLARPTLWWETDPQLRERFGRG